MIKRLLLFVAAFYSVNVYAGTKVITLSKITGGAEEKSFHLSRYPEIISIKICASLAEADRVNVEDTLSAVLDLDQEISVTFIAGKERCLLDAAIDNR